MSVLELIVATYGILLSILSYLSIRTLKQIDANQKTLSDDLKESKKDIVRLEVNLAQLQRAHDILAPSHCNY